MIISCDWGTSSCRVRVVDAAGGVLASGSGAKGIAATFADWQRSGLPESGRMGFYQAVLMKALGSIGFDVSGMPVVISGMASSSIGMMELPYHPLPFLVSGEDLRPAVVPATPAFPHVLLLVPGIRSADDVMRGEETQLIGCGGASGVFLFPGTHSKHIVVRDGRAVDFSTFMTGEVFGLLSRQSILAASVEAAGAGFGDAFLAGVDAARGSGLLHSAFSVRTNQLFGRYDKTDNYQYLSGLVIGEELKGLARQPVTLVAVPPLREAYGLALRQLGFTDVAHVDAGNALLEGQRQVYQYFGR
jgi:2-dehydro-3-deoxygalactonokinase